MTGTIWDLVEKEPLEGKEAFWEEAKKAPKPKDDSYLSTIKDYGKTILKGTVEGMSKAGRMMGGLSPDYATQRPLEEQTEQLNESIPVEEDFGQRALRRGLNEAPSVMAFPGSTLGTLPRAITAGFVGEGAKDLGAPEWAQTALELTAYVGPDITKKLLESGSNKDIIEFAKKMGMSDKEITPLIQSEFKQKWLTRISPKRGSTQEALSATKSKLDEAYGLVRKSEQAIQSISSESEKVLKQSFKDIFLEMPAGVRDTVKKDLKDLISKPITGDSLINFYADINHYLGPNTKQLSLLKDPIKKALSSISPELGKDFDMVNKLYTKYYPIAQKLKPTLASDLISGVELLGALGSIYPVLNIPVLSTLAGHHTTRKIAQQMLINPRFQQIGNKMTEALNQNKYGMAKKLVDLYSHELKDISPELSNELKDISEKDLKEFLNQRQPKE